VFRRAIDGFLRPAAVALVCATLAACGGGAGEGGDGGASASTREAGSAGRRGAEDWMVAAVSAGKPGAPVELGFELLERPVIGKPLPIAIAVTPRGTDIDALDVTFQSAEGVEVVAGAALGRRTRPADGQPISHEITVVPQRDGVFYVSAVALVENSTGTIARTFSIPLIAGGAAAAATAKPSAGTPVSDAAGEPIVSMPASESR
jgi:hypothetical protein